MLVKALVLSDVGVPVLGLVGWRTCSTTRACFARFIPAIAGQD